MEIFDPINFVNFEVSTSLMVDTRFLVLVTTDIFMVEIGDHVDFVTTYPLIRCIASGTIY